ncbi:MAG: U32 family peptidase [Clostridium sp.]|nr:U32 family peptidase [Clostridium sp.]
MELLCPAGNKESLIAAINSGANAVYLSGKRFGARAFAANFSNEELKEAIRIGKVYGVKIYVTMNTLVKENEVEEFLEQVEFLYSNGVDAILMQDFGMICLCLKKYPNLEIHASTQAHNSSLQGIDFLYKLGVKRVVLPREMSLDEIKLIKTPIEKEVFIHGALCVSYSGRCLMSQVLGGRSGNRGECAGCCRFKWKLYKSDKLLKEGYLLSMKELNLSEDILRLIPYVDSLKIEGRMKSPTYVSFITSYYRKILDGEKITDIDRENLQSLFYRGYTKGHLLNNKDLVNTKSPNHIGLPIGKVIDVTDSKITILLDKELAQEDGIRFLESGKGLIVNYLYDMKDRLISKGSPKQKIILDNKVGLTTLDTVSLTTNHKLVTKFSTVTKKVDIAIKVIAKINEPLEISFIKDNIIVSEKGNIVERAKSAIVTKERIISQVKRLGNTPFNCHEIDVLLDDDIFIPMGEINVLRRTLTERLIGKLMMNFKEPVIKDINLDYINSNDIDINNYKSIDECQFDIKDKKGIIHEIIDGREKDFIAASSCNITNSYTAYFLSYYGYKGAFLSTELTDYELNYLVSNIKKKTSIKLFVENNINNKVMTIKGNILNIDKSNDYYLVDPKNRKFKVIYDGRLTNIYSPYKLERNEKSINDVSFIK